MCGIVGFVGHEDAWPIIFEGLQRLEYRGYDSAGIAVVDSEGEFQFRKTVGKVSGLETAEGVDLLHGSAGIGHTRWATHGRPTWANAHPHTDCRHQVAVVHNGIVENFLELKRQLEGAGHQFSSETDTEVISHLVEDGMGRGLSFEEAFLCMGHAVKGSQAITAMLQGEEGKICAIRLGYAGGIVVAHNQGQGIVGSDLPAVLPILRQEPHGGQVGFLEPGEMVVVTREGVDYRDMDGNRLNKGLRTVSPEEVVIDKGGHPHFMLKEIMEQPQAVASALRGRVDFEAGRVELPGFPLSIQEVKDLQRVVLIGCGTSLHAAMIGRHLIETLSGLAAETESSSEFRYRDPYIDSRTLVVAIAQSGETADTVAAMQMVREKGARLIAICNVADSQASRLAENTLHMRAGIEIGVASSKTYTASLTILNVLATYLGQVKGHLTPEDCRRLVDDLASVPGMMGELLTGTINYQDLARQYSKFNNFLFLGRGINSPVAMEGALKLKELSYIHAEGYSAGEMKHGPIALIDSNMATVVIVPQDRLYDKVLNNLKEVKSREGNVLAIMTEGDKDLVMEVDHAVAIPQAPEHLIPLLATIPLQLLAYHIAVLRSCDVDQPRNLAKTVTVE